MSHRISFVAAFAAVVACVAGCSTAPKNESARANLKDEAQTTLRRFERSDTSITQVVERSPGYAVFPSVGKGGFIVGGSYGKGVVYEHGAPVGYSDISEGSFGLQAGGQSFSELIVFENQEALNKFKEANYGLGAQATAVAIKPGAAAQANFKGGVMIFTLTNAGLMAEAAVSGQRFRYTNGADAEKMNSEAGTASQRSDSGSTSGNKGLMTGSASVSTGAGGDTSAGGRAGTGSGSVSTPSGDSSTGTGTGNK
jgi:lipid-binding SYLF domain-containing protein